MLKRWVKAFLKVLAVLTVLLVLFLIVERVRGQVSLAHYKRRLVAQGEKMTPRDLESSIPGAENAAPQVYEAIERLTNGIIVPNDYPPCMKLTPSGRAVVGFRESEWVDGKKTNHWEQVAADLKPNDALLAAIRGLLAKPAFDNKLDYAQGFKMPVSHLAPPKLLTRWFGGAAQLALREGRMQDALDALEAQIRIPRLLAEDRVIISEMERLVLAAIARGTTWEALQADGWTEEQLARLQQAWADNDFLVAMARSFEGERVLGDVTSEMLRVSNEDTMACLSWVEGFSKLTQPFDLGAEERSPWDKVTGFFKKQIYCRVWRFAWSHQNQRCELMTMQRLADATRTAVVDKSSTALRELIAQIESDIASRNYYDRLRFPNAASLATTAQLGRKVMRVETERSMTICAIALKRYALGRGMFPASLEALVPEFLSALPVDYMDGKPLRYRLNADGGFTLYSVGDNLTDDGGDPSPLPGHTAARALWLKKDYLWPAPALPKEVEAYREEARRN